MTLLPKTLLGRNVLLLVVLILLGQLLAGVVYRQGVQKPIVEHFAANVAQNVLAMESALKAIPVELRPDVVAAFNKRTQARQQSTVAGAGNQFTEQLFISVASAIFAENGLNVSWQKAGENAVYMQLEINGQTYWLSTIAGDIGATLPHAVMVSWLVGLLLAVLGALAIQRVINRPLLRLAEASRSIGKGERYEPLEELGPGEIAQVCRSFNQMQYQLAEQENQRALMLAGVSHDLRTPLTKIRIAAEMLCDAENNDLIDSIVRSCQQSEMILQQFVDFAGADSSEPRSLCDINQLVTAIAHYSEAEFQVERGALPHVWVRRHGLERALRNLVENAQRYGAPEFTIATGLTGNSVFIDICDGGSGIPADRWDDMLKPFTRGNMARGGTPGSGLGLAIAQRLLALDGGALIRIDRPNGGLCVRVLLQTSTD